MNRPYSNVYDRSEHLRGGRTWRESLDRIAESVLALLLIVLAAPVLLLLAVLVIRADGRPVLYAGERLGLFKRPFTMFKFRSLVHDAETRIGGDIMSKKMAENMRLEHRHGRFLRDTRLDELPQLFNVLRGDMDFVGPRPIRRQVYDKHCLQVPNFDVRFAVRPGLLGPSQVFTAHTAPPRLRAMIDNRFVRSKKSFMADLGFALFVFGVLLRNLLLQLMRYSAQLYCTLRRTGSLIDRRRSARVPQEAAYTRICATLASDFKTYISHCDDEWEGPMRVLDVSNESLLIESTRALTTPRIDLRLEKNVARRGHIPKRRVAYMRGEVRFLKSYDDISGRYLYVVDYAAISPLNHYKLHQYFLEESVA